MSQIVPTQKHVMNLVTKPGGDVGTPAARARIEKAAQDFTAVALNEMLSPLFEGLKQDGGDFGGGQGEAAWRPMLTQEIAKSMAQNGGLGITTLVTQAMLRLQETRS